MARTNKYTSLNFNEIYEKKIINPNNNNNNNNSSSSSSSTSTSSSARSSSSSFSSAARPHKSYSLSASSRLGHGGMLVLSRPSPKPQPQPQPQPSPPLSLSPKQPLQQPQPPQSLSNSVAFPPIVSPSSSSKSSSVSDSISLRPQGKTGGSPSFQEREIKVEVPSPKTNKFVPPHLRPGYVAREVTSVPEFLKPRQGNPRPGSAHGNLHGSSPNRHPEDGRPKSGGGYDRRMRGPGAGASPVGVESDSFFLNRPRSGGSRPSSSG